jgi:hypothetical protein
LLAESDDLFSSAVVRSPLFKAWGTKKTFSFEELVALKQNERFRALAYRPAWRDRDDGPIMRADDSIERDIFRKLSGMRDMPAAARAEEIARPSWFSRIRDRLLSGPRAEYSLFQRQVDVAKVDPGTRKIIEALQAFMSSEEVTDALARLLPGSLPRLGFGSARARCCRCSRTSSRICAMSCTISTSTAPAARSSARSRSRPRRSTRARSPKAPKARPSGCACPSRRDLP